MLVMLIEIIIILNKMNMKIIVAWATNQILQQKFLVMLKKASLVYGVFFLFAGKINKKGQSYTEKTIDKSNSH